jgi:sporulation protein YlmC with PRC-barrel domain
VCSDIVPEITHEESFTMIRNLLATTAIATLVATGAFAQDATTPAPDPATPAPTETAPATDQAAKAPQMTGEGHLATQIIGESVYNGSGDDAENIGDVNDIVIGTDGNIQAIVVGVGGFLGIGEKDVAVDFAQLDWAERDGDRWLVAPMTKEQLETQAAFDRSAYEPEQPVASTEPSATPPAGGVAPAPDTTAEAPAPAEPAAPAPDATAEAPATTTPVPETTTQAEPAPAAPAPADQTAQTEPAAPAPDASTDTTTTGAIDKSTLKEMPATDIRAEEMIGTKVYGAGDVDVGEIGDVALTADGKIDAYIVDVGGFLGVGEKEVAIGSDNLAFMTDAQGNKYLYTNFTKEQLDAAAAYDKSTYAQKRDDQRLMMTQ